MNNSRRVLALLIMGLTSAAPATTQALAQETTSNYTIDNAVTKSMAHSPAVRGARERLTEVEATISQAFSTLFPSVSSALTGAYRKDAANNAAVLFGGEAYNLYDVRLQFTQPIYTAGAISGAIETAKAERQIRQTDLRIAERDVTMAAIQAFYATLFQKEKIERLKREKTRLEDYLATAQKRYREGRSRILEVLQVKTQLALIEPNLRRAESDLQLRTADLAYLTGDTQAAKINVHGASEPLDWAKLSASAASRQTQIPELEKARLTQKRLEEMRSVTLAKHYPNLGLEGNWGRSSFVKSDLLDDYSTSYTVGLKLTIPLFSGLSSIHERRAFASQLSQLEIEESRLRERFSLDQIKAEKELQLAQTVFETNRTALEISRDTLREATSAHRFGTATYVELFDSQRRATEAEIAFEQAKLDYILAQARYFTASGWDLRDLVQALSANGRS